MSQIARIEASLRIDGPAATLKRYFDCENGLGWKLVESGNARAVNVALALMPAADTCYGESITVALSYAMSANPRLMLGYADKYPKHFSQWCIPSLFDATDKEWKAAIDRAERAIRSVHDQKLASAKQICLLEIDRARRQALH